MSGAAPRTCSSNASAKTAGTRKLTCSPSRRAATLMPITAPWPSSVGPPLTPGLSEPEKKIVG
ncbi:MAG TPA: hypothetical protein VNR90_16815 [Vicinamibacterales bacterium]|nr:hypothetical protein [Vicinamibacterales bacterium]